MKNGMNVKNIYNIYFNSGVTLLKVILGVI